MTLQQCLLSGSIAPLARDVMSYEEGGDLHNLYCIRIIRISTTVKLHHSVSNEKLGEKDRWRLEAVPYKITVVQPCAFYLANHPRKTDKICSDELKSDILPWTPIHRYTNFGRAAKTDSSLGAISETYQWR